MIVFVVDELTTDPWMSLAFEGAREKALELGIRVTLGVIRKDEDPEESIFSICDSQSLVGYIFGTILTRKIDPPEPLFKVPSILVNCYDQQRRLPTIVPGDVAGGRAATERLIAAGCRRIALIDGQEGLDNPRDRLRGYKQALASNDLAYDPELVHYGNWEPSSGYKKTQALMKLPDPPVVQLSGGGTCSELDQPQYWPYRRLLFSHAHRVVSAGTSCFAALPRGLQ